jgi:hypothetical protein
MLVINAYNGLAQVSSYFAIFVVLDVATIVFGNRKPTVSPTLGT